ncbi:SOH1-domain-containing protein [Naematelia encephala]|uniref:Mediator of RNA polymerase II transcription subunit 31 n=1 Tax=Naematelia encephala TaxID=71784 RepID=A0A1Y2BBB9_9TREE|nr:SOH1-domain-containing protein [Naematelia encephala]
MQELPTGLPPPPLPDGSAAPPRSQERQANLIRFQSELEFVQCLANPLYLQELFVQKYFAQKEFLNYLKYLEYWREPEYVQFITYPTCLVFLTLLQSESFRARLADPGFVTELCRIGQRHHETWRVEKPPDALKTDDGKTN